jgi:hypothetical protein
MATSSIKSDLEQIVDRLALQQRDEDTACLMLNDMIIDETAMRVCNVERNKYQTKWVSSLITSGPAKTKNNLSFLNITDDHSVFFPLFNETSKHWSLVFYCKDPHYIFHYDSMQSMNARLAEEVVAMYKKKGIIREDIKLIEVVFSPQQEDVWECGYYMILILMIIMQKQEPLKPLNKNDSNEYKHLFNKRHCFILRAYLHSFFSSLLAGDQQQPKWSASSKI